MDAEPMIAATGIGLYIHVMNVLDIVIELGSDSKLTLDKIMKQSKLLNNFINHEVSS